MASFGDALVQPGGFVVAAELVTSRGPITSEGGAKVLALARDLAEDPRIDVLSVTDKSGKRVIGIVVDGVSDVLNVTPATIKPPPNFGTAKV